MMENKDLETVGREVAKSRRPKRSEQLQVHTEPGENSKYIQHNLELANLGKVDTTSSEEIAERIGLYFEICNRNDMKPSVASLALAFGVDRTTIWRWANETKDTDPRNSIKKALVLLDAQMTDYMQNGKINPVSGIFLMKNCFGYTDKQEVVITPNNPLGDTQDRAALEERYLDSVVAESAEETESNIDG